VRWVGRLVRRVIDRIRGAKPDDPFDFRQLGVRVPAVLVSPWIAPNQVVSVPLEHASIPASLRELFCAGQKPLTKRDKEAKSFCFVVSDANRLSTPRTLQRSSEYPDVKARRQAIGEAADAPAPAGNEATTEQPSASDSTFDRKLFAAAQRTKKVLQRPHRRAILRTNAKRADKTRGAPTPGREETVGVAAARDTDPITVFRSAAESVRRNRLPRP
jgi:hypothetical protein